MPRLSIAKLERHLYAAADILRREGMDAATYKDFIFGLLFLKRCSDVFEAERDKIIGRKIQEGVLIARQTTSMAHLGADRFARMPFPRPPVAEQSTIAERLARIAEALGAQQLGLQRIRQLKAGLTSDLLTGRVRVPESMCFPDAANDVLGGIGAV